MYNNEEYLKQVEKTSEYAKYRNEMKKIRKASNMSFIANIPLVVLNLPVFFISLISFDITGMLVPSFLFIAVTIIVTLFSTYKKNKIATLANIIFYMFMATQGAIYSFLAIPAIAIHINFIKALYNEDKLKQIEGYPLFDEMINTYSLLHDVDNNDIIKNHNIPQHMEYVSEKETDISRLERKNSKIEMEEINLDEFYRGDDNEYKQ